MKYVAVITRALQPEIHKMGEVRNGELCGEVLPRPDRVEIECDGPGQPCTMFRYTSAGEFCGDTWHESWDGAISQSEFEYGLSEKDFVAADSRA